MKKLLIPILFLLLAFPALSQNLISISGLITDTANGNPVPNHAVTISNDSTGGWVYYQTVYTNSNGYYYDTVPVPLNTQGYLWVSTIDCQNYMHQEAVNYFPSNTYFIVNFSICTSYNPCQAAFTSLQIPPLTVQFTDLSTGGGNIREWSFGDGGTSSQMNPVHQYAQPGYYGVTLAIGALGTTCYDTIRQYIFVSDSNGTSCHAAFVTTADSNSVNSFHFWDQSTGFSINTYIWNFGDGNVQTITFPASPNTTHVYAAPGIYTACLTIQGANSCFDMSCQTLIVGGGGGCHAAFISVPDSMNTTNTYHFIDQSTGTNISWFWNFGDPASGGTNTSTVQHPSHVFSAPGSYQVCLTITGADTTCYDMTCQTIFVGNGPGCQAYFSYMCVAGSYNTVAFTDLSAGNPTSWLWSFGDGMSSNQQNPQHTFAGPGSYPVCLTITGDSCTSTFCNTVVVSDSTSNGQIYGQVFAGNAPLEYGMVMIFSLDSNQNYNPYVAVSVVDSMGGYFFNQVPNGNYYIYAIPILPSGYLPTYFGDVLTWQSATIVVLGTPVNPYNINLIPAGNLMPGNGNINGQVNTGGLKSTSLDKVNMLLMNSDGVAIAYYKLDAQGNFTFPQLDYGTYFLRAEIPGVTSDLVTVVISAENPTATVIMTFSGNRILGIRDEAGIVSNWSVFPNPATDNITLRLELKTATRAEVGFYNLSGQLVLDRTESFRTGVNTIPVSTSSLAPGIYQMRIISGDGIRLTARIIIVQ